MQEFVRFLVASVVSNPRAIDIQAVEEDKGLTLELELDPADRDMLLADRAKLANAVRTMLDAWGSKHRQRVRLWILDDDDYEDEDEDGDGDSDDGDSDDGDSDDEDE